MNEEDRILALFKSGFREGILYTMHKCKVYIIPEEAASEVNEILENLGEVLISSFQSGGDPQISSSNFMSDMEEAIEEVIDD